MGARILIDSAVLVDAALKRLGEGSKSKLADRLRLGANGYQAVHRWTQGAEPPYAATMEMLRLLGWLDVEAAEANSIPEVSPTLARLIELTDGVARIAKQQDAILLRLETLESRRGSGRGDGTGQA